MKDLLIEFRTALGLAKSMAEREGYDTDVYTKRIEMIDKEWLKLAVNKSVFLSEDEKELIYQKERKKYEGSSWEVELDYHKETFMSGIGALIDYLNKR